MALNIRAKPTRRPTGHQNTHKACSSIIWNSALCCYAVKPPQTYSQGSLYVTKPLLSSLLECMRQSGRKLSSITLRYTALHCIKFLLCISSVVYCISMTHHNLLASLHSTALHSTTLQYTTTTTTHCAASQCICERPNVAWWRTMIHHTLMRLTALHHTELHCTTLQH